MHDVPLQSADRAADVSSSHVTVHLADTPDVPFLFERTQGRMGGAFGASVVAHVVFVGRSSWSCSRCPTWTRRTHDPRRAHAGRHGLAAAGRPRRWRWWRRQQVARAPAQDGDARARTSCPCPWPSRSSSSRRSRSRRRSRRRRSNSPSPRSPWRQGTEQIVGALQGVPDPSSTSQGSGTGGGAGTGRGTGIGPGTGSGLGPGSGGGHGRRCLPSRQRHHHPARRPRGEAPVHP